MKKYLLSSKGNFYKSNLHVHTTVSDGKMSPQQVKDAYKQQGYSVVAFTDHEIMVPQQQLTDNDFLALTATEISVNNRYDCDFRYVKTYHLNIYSPYGQKNSFNTFDSSKIWLESYQYVTDEQQAMDSVRLYGTDGVNQVIQKATSEGCLVSYNHPVWSMQDYTDYADLVGLWGVEVYNNGCVNLGCVDTTVPFDDLLRKGQRVFPLATDDAHRIGDCFGGFVMISAPSLTYDNIFAALKNGDFYASTGPQIFEISIENGVVSVDTSPAAMVILSTECRYAVCQKAQEEPLCNATFDINYYLNHTDIGASKHRYVRITVVDANGKHAYSRAYFMDELI